MIIYCPSHTDIFYHKAFCLNHLRQQFFYSPLSSAIHVQESCDHWTCHTRVEIILITGIHQGPCQSSVVGFGAQPRKRLGSKSGLLQCLSSLLKSSLCLMRRNKEASVIWKDLLGAHALLLSGSLLSWFLLGNWFFLFFFFKGLRFVNLTFLSADIPLLYWLIFFLINTMAVEDQNCTHEISEIILNCQSLIQTKEKTGWFFLSFFFNIFM